MTHPSDADHDVAGMQIGVHKVVGQQHLEVGVHAQGHNLGVEGARLPDVLRHALSCKMTRVEGIMTTLCVHDDNDNSISTQKYLATLFPGQVVLTMMKMMMRITIPHL